MERESYPPRVMAGRVPAIHVFAGRAKDVDGRHKGGHDVWCVALQRFWVLDRHDVSRRGFGKFLKLEEPIGGAQILAEIIRGLHSTGRIRAPEQGLSALVMLPGVGSRGW